MKICGLQILLPLCSLKKGANIIVNLSASNDIIGKSDYRRIIVKAQSGSLLCTYMYANAGIGESTTDMVYSGHSIISENGALSVESERFSKCVRHMESFSDRCGCF